MYLTAMPAIATFTMAGNHIKTNSVGSVASRMLVWSWYGRRRNSHKHDPAPFSLYNLEHNGITLFLTTKTTVRKKPGKRRSDGSCAWTSRCLRKGWGDGVQMPLSGQARRHEAAGQ